MSDPTLARLEALVAGTQARCDVYWKIYNTRGKTLTAKQEAALAKNLDSLARQQRQLDAYRAKIKIEGPPVFAIDLPDEPIANLGTVDQTYGCPPGWDREAFEARYGFTIEHAFSRVVTGLLRPNLARYQDLVDRGLGMDQATANHFKRGLVTIQKSVIDYFAGRLPFSVGVAPYVGGWNAELGCADLSQIRDLGAGA